MKLSKEQKDRLEEMIKKVSCPDFNGPEKDIKNLPELNLISTTDLFECQYPKVQICTSSLSFGYSYFCKCPARVQIKKEFDI